MPVREQLLVNHRHILVLSERAFGKINLISLGIQSLARFLGTRYCEHMRVTFSAFRKIRRVRPDWIFEASFELKQ